jgi:hypothetical protein
MDETQQFQSSFNNFYGFMSKVDNRFLATSIKEQAKRHVIYPKERRREEKRGKVKRGKRKARLGSLLLKT